VTRHLSNELASLPFDIENIPGVRESSVSNTSLNINKENSGIIIGFEDFLGVSWRGMKQNRSSISWLRTALFLSTSWASLRLCLDEFLGVRRAFVGTILECAVAWMALSASYLVPLVLAK
jgi:hypothetical protein